MIYRDISQINLGACAIITNSNTVTTYSSTSTTGNNTTIRTYELIGNTYVLRTQTTGNYPSNNTSICQSNTTLQTLQSNFDHMEPIFGVCAFLVALLLFALATRLIIYPFWRKS